MRSCLLVLLYVFGAASLQAKEKPSTIYAIPLPAKPDFSALEWLIGNWNGYTTSRGAQGEIHLSVEFTLDRRFIVFREELTLAASGTAPAAKEAWMGILSGGSSGATFVLRLFSSTGFVTRCRVSLDGPEVHFDPDGGDQPPPGWLFRRNLLRSDENEFTETVQVAPPQRSFFDYYTAKLTRVPRR